MKILFVLSGMVLAAFWLYVFPYLYLQNEAWDILFSYVVLSVYFWILYYFFGYCIRKKYSFLIPSILHFFCAILFFVSVTYYQGKTELGPVSDDELFQNIFDSYVEADASNEQEEIQVYGDLLINEFPNRSADRRFSFENTREILSTSEYVRNLEKSVQRNFADINAITVLDFYNLSREELQQGILTLMVAEKYYSAQFMLFRYVAIFGEDPYAEELTVSINEALAHDFIPPHERRIIEFERELVRWRELLEDPASDELDIIVGYRSLLALEFIMGKDNTITWLLENYIERLRGFTFFAGDMRLSMITRWLNKDAYAVMDTGLGKLISTAKKLLILNDFVYLKDMELVQLNHLGKVQWHISVPYAKLQNNTLYVTAVEKNNGFIRHEPKVLQGNYTNEDWYLEIPLSHRELSSIAQETSLGTIWLAVALLPSWIQYALPINTLYFSIVHSLSYLLACLLGGFCIMNYALSDTRILTGYGRNHAIKLVFIVLAFVPLLLCLRAVATFVTVTISSAIAPVVFYVFTALYVALLSFQLYQCVEKLKVLRKRRMRRTST